MQEPNDPVPARAGILGVALRLFWSLLGYSIVFMLVGIIIVNDLAFPSMLDGVIWLTVALMIVVRRVDITRWHGTTTTGEPATLADWRSYSMIAVLVTAAASAIAHTLG